MSEYFKLQARSNFFLILRRDETLEIPDDLDYFSSVPGLCDEEREKLSLSRPCNVAAAARISGVTPNGVLCLLRYVKKHKSDNYGQREEEFSVS